MGSWKYIGISSVDFKKSHIYEMVATSDFFSYMWTAFYVPGGGERRGKGEKKGREKRREERGKTHSNSNHDGHHRSRDRSSVQKNEEKE